MNKFHNNAFPRLSLSLALILGLSVAPRQSQAEEQIEALRAPFHVGETVLACGRVAQVSARSDVTYINLDRPYPNHTLALVVWQSNLLAYESRFGRLSTLEGKRVCALGTIEHYRNGLQVIMKNPQFLRLMTS